MRNSYRLVAFDMISLGCFEEETKDAYNGERALYCKMPIKHIIDFLSLDMVVLLKEVLEGVEDGQNVINKSCRAYPL